MNDDVTKGITITLLSFALWSVMDVAIKYVSTALPHSQVMWIRFASQLFLIWIIFGRNSKNPLITKKNPLIQLFRASLLLSGALLNIYAVQYLPLTITTITFLSCPLMVCLISSVFLKEQIGIRRIAAILIGFVGVGVAINPSEGAFNLPLIASLLSSLAFAIFSVITRFLRNKSTPEEQSTWVALVPVIVLFIPTIGEWETPQTTSVWIALAVIGIASAIAGYLISMAHKFAPASILAPFLYSMILWGSILSWLVFDQPITTREAIGSTIVVLSGLFIWIRERKLAKQGTIPAKSPTRNVLFRR